MEIGEVLLKCAASTIYNASNIEGPSLGVQFSPVYDIPRSQFKAKTNIVRRLGFEYVF